MKSFLTIVSLIGFTGVAIFGVFLMIHANNVSHASCLPTLMGSSECASINPIEYVRVHIGAFTELVNGIPSFGALAALSVLLILLFVILIFKSDDRLLILEKQNNFSYEDVLSVVREKILKWTALHEKRDPSLAIALST